MLLVSAVIGLIVGAAIIYAGTSVGQGHTTTVTRHSQNGPLYLEVVGSLFYALEVTDAVNIPSQGYVQFPNDSITFQGVKFQTICPASAPGCPGSTSGTQTNPGLSVTFLKFSVTFPDAKKETLTLGIAGLSYAPILSTHVKPKAGILVEYIAGRSSYRAFLLVTPYTLPGGT